MLFAPTEAGARELCHEAIFLVHPFLAFTEAFLCFSFLIHFPGNMYISISLSISISTSIFASVSVPVAGRRDIIELGGPEMWNRLV